MVVGSMQEDVGAQLAGLVRSIPDYPKQGILFRDITTVLKDAHAFQLAVDALAQPFLRSRIDKVAAIESRGFILGAALAHRLNAGFVPIRKAGKLPAGTVSEEYDLEYGNDRIEMHTDAIAPGERILLHDDLLATGGTMGAAIRLVERQKGIVVGVSFLVELDSLRGREKLGALDVMSVIHFEGD